MRRPSSVFVNCVLAGVAVWLLAVLAALLSGCASRPALAPPSPPAAMPDVDPGPLSDPYELPPSDDVAAVWLDRSAPLATLLFAFDSAAVSPSAQAALDALAVLLPPGAVLRLDGHACSIGPAAYNLTLGLRRAEAVREALIALGVDPGALRSISYGESRPTGQDRRYDRRVEVWAE